MTIRTIPKQPRAALAHLRNACPHIAATMDAVGPFRMGQEPASMHALTRAIIGQQLNIVVAARIAERFDALLGKSPQSAAPRRVLALSDEQLRGAGLSGAKMNAVRALAEFWQQHRLTPARLEAMPDDEVLELLTQIKGIGPWTVKMFLMFSLRRADVMPHEDYGLRAGLKKIHALEDLPSRADTEALTESWRPWRSVGTWYCWQFLKV